MKNIICNGVSLKYRLLETYHIDYLGMDGLERFITAAYGKNMEMTESPNDTSYEIEVESKEEFDKYEKENIEKIIEKGWFEHYNLRLVIQDLVNKDILPVGNYIIRMSW